MTEWIITSSVLVLVVIVLRTVLKGKISLRLQYALWALVLVRLLIPGSLFGSTFSVMNAVGSPSVPAEITVADPPARTEFEGIQLAPSVTEAVDGEGNTYLTEDPEQWEQDMDAAWEDYKEEHTEYITLPVGDILRTVRYAGMAVVALWLIVGNLRFYLRLTRSREIVKYAPPALYVAEGIETPCLFGLFSPAVYVTPEVAADETALAHVLAHEETHYRHKDHIWALLRCVCLVLHWYNPLVWLAAALSRRDAELACDEGAIRRLGEEQRTAYGRTLIGLTCTGVGGLLRTATTMTGSRKSIKERIVLIAQKPKMKLYTLLAVILIAAVAAGCTFTGAKQTPEESFLLCVDDLEKQIWGETLLAVCGGEDLSEDVFRGELLPILQEIQTKDFKGEPEEGTDNGLEPELGVLLIDATEKSALTRGGLYFSCLPEEGMLYAFRGGEYAVDEKYSYDGAVLLDCPELYDFILRHRETKSPEESGEAALDDLVRQVMEEHAAELTARWGYAVLTGERIGCYPVESDAAEPVKICRAEYYLLHSEREGFSGAIRHTRYLFLLQQGDDLILLGHMDETTLANEYGTNEMLGKYGDMYTAAAKELYAAFHSREDAVTALRRMEALTADDIDLISSNGWADVTAQQVADALNGAVDHETRRAEGMGEWYSLTLYLSEDHSSRSEYFRLSAGLEEDLVRVTYRNTQNKVEDRYFKDSTLYRLIRSCYRTERKLDEAFSRYQSTLEARARTTVDTITNMQGERAYTGYDIYEFTCADTFETENYTYTLYHWNVAFATDDIDGVIWCGGMTLDAEGRVRGAEDHTYFVVREDASGREDCRFLGWQLYFGGDEQTWRDNALHSIESAFAAKDSTLGAIYGNPKVYRCRETDPQKAAETLVAAYVDDLTKMDNMRPFTITEYRNLEVFVTPTLEMSETDRSVHNYNLQDTEIGENHWIVEFTMEYRWIGVLDGPPAGPGNGEVWLDQVHQGSPVGFLLTRDGDEFVLRSRYATR